MRRSTGFAVKTSLGRRGVYGLHIFNDLRSVERNAHVGELMRRVEPRCRPHTRVVSGCLITTVSWKHWPCLFPQHGSGRKYERELGMTEWQWEIITEHPADFLRGLFHSGGCRIDNWATRVVAGEIRRYGYGGWQLSNCSGEILTWCGDALELLGVPWRPSSTKHVLVSTRAGVALLDELIGRKG